jgi:hypothetical protein
MQEKEVPVEALAAAASASASRRTRSMEPMAPYRLPVVTEVKSDREGRKSRIFRAELVCFVTANRLWELGVTAKEGILRPVLLAYAATEQEARAVTANLRTGRPIVEDTRSSSRLRLELPRSAGFQLETHSRDGGTLTLAYLRSAFALQPSIAVRQHAVVDAVSRSTLLRAVGVVE